jgi:hypothetical protein
MRFPQHLKVCVVWQVLGAMPLGLNMIVIFNLVCQTLKENHARNVVCLAQGFASILVQPPMQSEDICQQAGHYSCSHSTM